MGIFNSDAQILVVGDVMLDGYARGEVERISPEAPVPVLRHLAHNEVAGGAANVAVNLAALGCHANLLGIVGADDEADRLDELLVKAGVVAHLVRSNQRPTISKLRIVAGNHQLIRIDKEDVSDPDETTEDTLVAQAVALVPSMHAVILSDYAKGCLTDKVIQAIIAAAQSHDIPVLVDPKRPAFASYRGASIITPNRSELKAATGITCSTRENCRTAARIVMSESGASILLTLSEQGMVLFSPNGEEIWLPTDAQEVFDVSGAGDSVVAAFTLALVSGSSETQALRIANCAAAIVIGRAGTATTTEAEIIDALEREHHDPHTKSRVSDLASAIEMRARWHRQGLTVGFTNGCFDLLHPGHIDLLRESARHCDRLIVAINSDASVQRLKGESRPIQAEDARADVMAAVRFVDMVVIFEQDTPRETIEALLPDVLIKGADYQEHEIVGAKIVKAAGGSVVRVDMRQGHSTTELVKRSAKH